MKLSDLVAYRNELCNLSLDSIKSHNDMELNKVTEMIHRLDVLPTESKNQFDDLRIDMNLCVANLQKHLDHLQIQINDVFSQQSRIYLHESSTRYEQTILNRDVHRPEYLNLDRHLPYKLREQDAHLLKARLARFTHWQCPGLIIHPGQESFVEDMVANDPLYLLDDRHELLDTAIKRFPEQYQHRLCKYIINETLDDQNLMDFIPDEQFGLSLVYNYFHWRPFEIIQKYLNELYKKIRPGGVLIFTINDCDRPAGIKLVEQKWCYFTPLSMVLNHCQRIGFTTEFTWHDGGAATWIEIRKPGKFESIRGGQSLATVVPKPIAKSK